MKIIARIALLLLLWIPTSWALQPKLALVIGNANYKVGGQLQNTLNDAQDIKSRLEGIGFNVTFLQNVDGRQMRRSISEFLDRIKNQTSIALIYYSGHGAQDDNHANYLLPVDSQIIQPSDISADGISVNTMLDQLNQRPDGAISLLILDACRNNPFADGTKGGKFGLAPITAAPSGTLVLYAATPGQTASDNHYDRNGLFTKYLLEYLPKPNLDIDDVFEQTAIAVKQASANKQIPYKEGNLLGKYYLVSAAPNSQVSTVGTLPASDAQSLRAVETGPNAAAVELEFWHSVDKCGTEECLKSYLTSYPHGVFLPIAKARIDALHTLQTPVETPPVVASPAVSTTAPSQLGYLQVNVNTNAQVQIDERLAGQAEPGHPLNLLDVPVGKHNLVITAINYLSQQTLVPIELGQWTQVVVTLLPNQTPSLKSVSTLPNVPPVSEPADSSLPVPPSSEYTDPNSPDSTDSRSLPYGQHHVDTPSFHCSESLQPVEFIICTNSELAWADGIMGNLYREIKIHLVASDADAVRISQRSWLKQRNHQCSVSDEDVHSVAKSLSKAACLLRATNRRIDELRAILKSAP